MLFPTNPDRRPELWEKFSDKIKSQRIALLVHDGKALADPNGWPNVMEGSESLIEVFRAADIIKFGADRGQAIGPFFALKLVGGAAHLVEYAIDKNLQSASSSAVQEALQGLAICILFENMNVSEISVPFVLHQWDLIEWKLLNKAHETILMRAT